MIKNKIILAKSNQNGICLGDSLIEHSVATMNLGVSLIKSIIKTNNSELTAYIDMIQVATLFHDIGKCASKFQKKMNKEESIEDVMGIKIKKNKLYHQVLSWAFLSYRTKMGKSPKYRNALKAILYHHPIDMIEMYQHNSSIYQFIKDEGDVEIFESSFNELKKYLPSSLIEKIDLVDVGKNENTKFYDFCELVADDEKSKDNDVKFFIIRACLIVADRYVSNLTNKKIYGELENIINNDKEVINNIINNFLLLNSDFNNIINQIKSSKGIDINRFNNQLNIILNDTIDKKTSIIGAAAGFGKTLIGLLWGVYHQKKLIWVCPRNIIAENTYLSLKDDLSRFGIENIKVGLYYESEYKNIDHEENIDYDIVVTNIDNYLNSIIKNNVSNKLYNMINSYVIFDEYHEFLCNQPLFPQFIQLIKIRHQITQGKTLLLSATPIRLDKKFWNCDGIENVFYKVYESHAKNRKHQILCYDNSDLNNIEVNNNSDTCVLLNTVPSAQVVSLNNEDVDNVFHTRYPKNVLEEKKKKLINNHNKYANVNNRFSTISTRIIGTGLDISYSNLIESVISPEATIQAIGRIDRMSELIQIPKEEYHYLDNTSENTMKNNIYDKNLSYKWFQFLSTYHNQVITLQDYYNLYNKFNIENENDLMILYEEFYKTGLNELRKLKPYKSYPKDRDKKNSILTPSTNSYRGLNTSLYVCARYRDKGDKIWSKNNVCNNIIIADHVFSNRFNSDLDKETTSSDQTRRTIIKDQAPNWNKDEYGNEKLHYKGNTPKYSYSEFKDLGIYPETPLVMVNFYYNDKIGLYHKDILK